MRFIREKSFFGVKFECIETLGLIRSILIYQIISYE